MFSINNDEYQKRFQIIFNDDSKLGFNLNHHNSI